MDTLYIVSIAPKAGKTMFAEGLYKMLRNNAKIVSYGNPIFSDAIGSTEDEAFMQTLLGIDESGSQPNDISIIEGLFSNLSTSIKNDTQCKVLVIHDYSMPLVEGITEYQKVKTQIAGIIVNKVPANKLERLSSQYMTELAQAGLTYLGAIPENRMLMTISIKDMVEIVKGKIVNNTYDASELIENFMLGSSTFDRGPAYYKRKNNKAVLVWGDRPGVRKAALAGLQVSALATSTRCIVISHNGVPLPNAVQKADEQKVALISAPGTLHEIVDILEKYMASPRYKQEKKLPIVEELINKHIDKHVLQIIM